MRKLIYILWLLSLPAFATIRNVKTNCGATGNGSTNDTTAINTCIGQLVSGDTLLFPAGTYITTSMLTVNLSNITIDGSSNTATIKNTSTSSNPIFRIGQGGIGRTNTGLGAKVNLSATANELSTSFTTVSSLGVVAGDFVYLSEGGKDGNLSGGGITSDIQCDAGGCRGEIVKVLSVSGNTVTVTTFMHDTYSPSVNAATAQKITGMLTGLNVHDISFDGNDSNNYGFQINDIADSTFTNINATKVLGSGVITTVGFNTTFRNITVTHSGSAGCGGAFHMELYGNPTIIGMSLSQMNSAASVCLNNGSFGWNVGSSLAGGKFSDITVDKTASGGGRPVKIDSTRYTIFNNVDETGGSGGYNGITLEFYSSHNLFNNCSATNNAGSSGNAGVNGFGNFDTHNTFINCTVTGNGNVQLMANDSDNLALGADSNWIIIGGTYTGQRPLYISSDHAIVQGTTSNGGGVAGIGLTLRSTTATACVNTNTFVAGTGLTSAINSSNATNVGSGNVLNGLSSNLTAGSCNPISVTSSLTFGSNGIGNQSTPQTATFSNNTGGAVTIASMVPIGDFVQTGGSCTVGLSVSSGSTCTMSIAFSPTVVGARTGIMALMTSSSPLAVQLSGTGTSGPAAPTGLTVIVN